MRSPFPRNLSKLCVLVIPFLASCAVGPDYVAPQAELESAFKNTGFSQAPPEGSWWSLFNDPELSRLIKMADTQGQGVRSELARYDQARATLGLARADIYPSVTADAYARRQKDSSNSNFSFGVYNEYRAALNLSWEIDLWGRVRRSIGAAEASLLAAEYDYQGLILSLRGEITRAYVSLRFADAEIALLEKTSKLRGEARRLMKARFDGGASSKIDYQRSITEDESVKAELAQLRARRERYENALAVLTGQSAAGYHLAANGRTPTIPVPPSAVPSDLLRRRPDLAANERRLAYASETIGVAIATYLPRISITGEGGFRSLSSTDLFDPQSKLWGIAPELVAPIFQGGRGFSDKARAEAAYREALGIYRGSLLSAIQETEDALGDVRHLAVASASRKKGSTSAAEAATLTRKRYNAGVTDYFEVVESERTALNEEQAALSIELARALAATHLIQSLGGGWQR
ncbi:efflux transporter outer membrane subunit [Haloferula chungangensis]|uniref:Efflux transporter outer membrane subunit n=1 Tax=Haloferula chungangensis TaxID=1048331 RepID=A0ABW2LE49_9BACT